MKALPKFKTLRQYDNHLWIHPWDELNHLGSANRPIIQKAKGIYIYDELGHKIIDGPGGMWCTQIGYGNLDMVKAITEQLKKLNYASPFFNTSPIAALTANMLTNLAPGDLKHIFFTPDGSSANDTALRFVQFYFNVLNEKQKKHIIAQGNSYHGSTHLSSSVSSKEEFGDFFDFIADRIHFLPSLHRDGTQQHLSQDEFCKLKINEFLACIDRVGPENVAAFIAEPIQASGGLITPPTNYLKECSRICKENDILYISDEVVTGFGRVGHWFASKDVFGIDPDMITCAKGISSGYLPIGAVLISDRLIQNLNMNRVKNKPLIFNSGFTYSGHPASCAAVVKNLEIISSLNLLQHVQELTPYFQQELQKFSHFSMIKEIRGMGFLGCLEMKTDISNRKHEMTLIEFLSSECYKKGLLVRSYLNNIIFSPPLIITKRQIKTLFGILNHCCELTQKKFY